MIYFRSFYLSRYWLFYQYCQIYEYLVVYSILNCHFKFYWIHTGGPYFIFDISNLCSLSAVLLLWLEAYQLYWSFIKNNCWFYWFLLLFFYFQFYWVFALIFIISFSSSFLVIKLLLFLVSYNIDFRALLTYAFML